MRFPLRVAKVGTCRADSKAEEGAGEIPGALVDHPSWKEPPFSWVFGEHHLENRNRLRLKREWNDGVSGSECGIDLAYCEFTVVFRSEPSATVSTLIITMPPCDPKTLFDKLFSKGDLFIAFSI